MSSWVSKAENAQLNKTDSVFSSCLARYLWLVSEHDPTSVQPSHVPIFLLLLQQEECPHLLHHRPPPHLPPPWPLVTEAPPVQERAWRASITPSTACTTSTTYTTCRTSTTCSKAFRHRWPPWLVFRAGLEFPA